jgi:hypothetical protein
MSSWCKLYEIDGDSPAVALVRRRLECSALEAEAWVARLWRWAMRHARDGQLPGREALEAALGYEGTAGVLVTALIDGGAVEDDVVRGLVIVDWSERFPLATEAAAKKAKRDAAKAVGVRGQSADIQRTGGGRSSSSSLSGEDLSPRVRAPEPDHGPGVAWCATNEVTPEQVPVPSGAVEVWQSEFPTVDAMALVHEACGWTVTARMDAERAGRLGRKRRPSEPPSAAGALGFLRNWIKRAAADVRDGRARARPGQITEALRAATADADRTTLTLWERRRGDSDG